MDDEKSVIGAQLQKSLKEADDLNISSYITALIAIVDDLDGEQQSL